MVRGILLGICFMGCSVVPTVIPFNSRRAMYKLVLLLLASGCCTPKTYTLEETRGEICQTAINRLREESKVGKIEREILKKDLEKCNAAK